MLTNRPVYDEEHSLFRDAVRGFIKAEITPHFERWEEAGTVDRRYWQAGGEAGLLCPQTPEAYGGPGGDFRHNAVVVEEIAYAGYAGPVTDYSVHSDVCAGYLLSAGTEAQKQHWLPRMVSGQAVCAVAMTEPGTGSDLQGVKTRAVREGDTYRINGSKTFISNGQHCDLVIVVARTSDTPGAKGISLVLVEADRAGFRRGRKLHKLGQLSADTSEMFFDDVVVPMSNLMGGEGTGFATLLGSIFGNEFVATFWSVSPVAVAALSGYGIWQATQVALRVVAARDGLRDEAQRAQHIGLAALVFMGVVLVVPWSIGMVPDGVSDALGAELPYDEPAPLWLSAEDIQSVTPAEAHPDGRARFAEGWGALDVGLDLMLAFAWTAFTAGWIRNLAATGSSAGAPLRITVGARITLIPTALLLAAAVVGYIMAWVAVAPNDSDATFLPGFFPILAILPLLWMGKHILIGVQRLRPAPIPAIQ